MIGRDARGGFSEVPPSWVKVRTALGHALLRCGANLLRVGDDFYVPPHLAFLGQLDAQSRNVLLDILRDVQSASIDIFGTEFDLSAAVIGAGGDEMKAVRALQIAARLIGAEAALCNVAGKLCR